MSDWSVRPRSTPFAGRRKATHRWCPACETLHRTERAVGGPDVCPATTKLHGTAPHLPVVRLKSLAPKSPFAPGNRR